MRRGPCAEAPADDLRRAYERHWAALVRLSVLLSGDRATGEDIVQDVFIRARGRLSALPDDAVYPYLRRGVVNGWRNVVRHRTVERAAARTLQRRPAKDPTVGIDEHDAMWRRIDALPSRQRAVVVLRYYEDLPDHEIARLLRCTRGTVRSQANRAMNKLREGMSG